MSELNRNRTLGSVIRALFQPRQYRAARTATIIIKRPFRFLSQYTFGQYSIGHGQFPSHNSINTPIGTITLTANSWHDLRTIHEIFCAGDYPATASDTIVVDYGSNIGISGAYFLSRSQNSFCYLFEPLPSNTRTLQQNLHAFTGRYLLTEAAVGLDAGRCEFGCEPTGRYGGLTQKTGSYVVVEVQKSREILQNIIDKHGTIDILKIDIEGLEQAVVEDLPLKTAKAIRKLYVEHLFTTNPLSQTHDVTISGSVSQFVRKDTASPTHIS